MKKDKTEVSEKVKAHKIDAPFERFRRLATRVVSAPKPKEQSQDTKCRDKKGC